MHLELTEGIWTIKNLAEWFGMKPNSLSHNKEKKLKELKEYADFEITKSGKIKIIKVKKTTYEKNNVYNYYKENIPRVWRYNQIDTCSRVASEIYTKKNSIEESTGYQYTRRVRDNLWGKPHKGNPRCFYKLAKLNRSDKDKKYDTYTELTKEELKIFSEEYNKFFKAADSAEDKFMIQDQVENGEITPEEAYGLLFPTSSYKKFLEHVSWEVFNCDWIVRGTFVERDITDEGPIGNPGTA